MASFNQEIEMDRISDLPDPILGIILSHLPIKNAIATSILSTRWKNLFPFSFLPIHLDLDDSLLSNKPNYDSVSFLDFVDKMLKATLLDLSRVETIRVFCKRNGFYAKFPDNVSMRKLKRLELNGLSISDSIQGLLDGCPVLEDLRLVRFTFRAPSFIIRSNVLKNLTISEGSTFDMAESFDIDTPNVQMLTCECSDPGVQHDNDYNVAAFKALSSAHIDISPFKACWGFVSRVHKVVAACASTSRLYLGSRTIYILINSPSQMLPTFQNLTWLGLGYVQSEGWVIFGRVLNHTPNLKELICKEGFKNNIGFGGGHLSGFQEFAWEARDCDCLEYHLQKIEFCVFNWTEIEMELLEFFLVSGKVLETLIIRGRPLDIGTENRLLSFPNHSKVVLESI